MEQPDTIDETRPRTGGSRDRGSTILEMLVALVLMGTAVAVVLPAMWVAVRASRTSDSEAQTIAVLGDAANRLTRAGWTVCPEVVGATSYESVVDTAAAEKGWPSTAVSVDSITYWNSTTKTWGSTNPLGGSGCLSATSTASADQSLQRVTITAQSPDGNITRSLEVLLGDMRSHVGA